MMVRIDDRQGRLERRLGMLGDPLRIERDDVAERGRLLGHGVSLLELRSFVDSRDVGRDHFPADVREAHPGLHLTTRPLAAAHLIDDSHGGEVTAQGDDVQPMTLFLGARARRACHAMGMDTVEAVAMLVVSDANGVRAVPESVVEDLDVLVDQRLLVGFEQRSHFFDDFRNIRLEIGHFAASRARATATKVASLPRGPIMERPTGNPSTVAAPGILTCGCPANPPCAQRQVMRSRSGSSVESFWPTRGAGNGVVGRQRIVPSGRRCARRARTSWRIRLAHARSVGGIIDAIVSRRATEKAMRGLRSSSQPLNVSYASAGCSVLCARAHTESPCGAMMSSRPWPIRAASCITFG